MIKKFIRSTLNTFGYELVKLEEIDEDEKLNKRVSKLGSPKTIIDCGVGRGTPYLYESFPNSNFILIEPIAEFEREIKNICDGYGNRFCYVRTSLGSKKERKKIQVDPLDLQWASFHDRTKLTKTDSILENREVDVTTMDDLLVEYALEPPFGMKIDTEGNELDVIRGASRFLLDAEFVIAEVSVAKRFKGSYLFEEFVLEMMKNEFYVFEFLTNRENIITGTRFVDIAFLNSKFGDRR